MIILFNFLLFYSLIGDVKEFVSTYAQNVRLHQSDIQNHTDINNNNVNEYSNNDNNNNNNNDNIEDEYPLLSFIVAADVFMYVGDLEDILVSCYDVLKASCCINDLDFCIHYLCHIGWVYIFT
jgi:hypothetical protein